MKLEEMLQIYREEHGISCEKMAEELKISRYAYYCLETGKTYQVHMNTFFRIVRILRLDDETIMRILRDRFDEVQNEND